MACSSAQRLKPEGIYVHNEIDVKNWFLAPSNDLRSSNMMEIVASEFKVQGLELDWGLFAGMLTYEEILEGVIGIIILLKEQSGISEENLNSKDI